MSLSCWKFYLRKNLTGDPVWLSGNVVMIGNRPLVGGFDGVSQVEEDYEDAPGQHGCELADFGKGYEEKKRNDEVLRDGMSDEIIEEVKPTAGSPLGKERLLVSGMAVRVYKTLYLTLQTNEGLTDVAIAEAVNEFVSEGREERLYFSLSQVKEALGELLSYGYVYTTVDDSTFAITPLD